MSSMRALEISPAPSTPRVAHLLDLYDQAAGVAPMGAFECDLASERLTWTAGLFDIFGLPPERPVERPLTVGMYRESARELLERKRARAIATRSGFTLDANIVRFDGSERWVRISAAVRSSNGRARALYGMKLDITEDRARWERLRAEAECDPLTGVANRVPFQRFLEQTAADPYLDEIGALILFDLDGFKQINDRWGHAAGDRCLIAFGERLRHSFPHARLVARIGGDEFAVLLPPLGSRVRTRRVVQALVAGLVGPVAWNGDLLPLGASAGLAIAPTVSPLDPAVLFAEADRTLYTAKKAPAARIGR